MPIHRVPSGPDENDIDVLEKAIKRLEAAGEEIVHVQPWVAWPVGELVLVTRKAKRTETRTKS